MLQLAVLPTAMKGRKDIVGAAETGSGKTLAFGIPMLYGIIKDKEFELKKMKDTENEDTDEDGDQTEADQESSNQEEEEEEAKETEDLDQSDDETEFGKVIDVADLKFEPFKSVKGQKKLRGLIITPTRELAVQIEKHLKAIAKYTDITIALVIGGMAAPKQERILSKGPDIVIGTPGRLWEMIEGGNAHLSQVDDIR